MTPRWRSIRDAQIVHESFQAKAHIHNEETASAGTTTQASVTTARMSLRTPSTSWQRSSGWSLTRGLALVKGLSNYYVNEKKRGAALADILADVTEASVVVLADHVLSQYYVCRLCISQVLCDAYSEQTVGERVMLLRGRCSTGPKQFTTSAEQTHSYTTR